MSAIWPLRVQLEAKLHGLPRQLRVAGPKPSETLTECK